MTEPTEQYALERIASSLAQIASILDEMKETMEDVETHLKSLDDKTHSLYIPNPDNFDDDDEDEGDEYGFLTDDDEDDF